MKNFKTKKKSLYHLGNFQLSPPHSNQRLGLGLGSNTPGQTLLFSLFFLAVGSGSSLLPLPLFVLVYVSLEIS